MKNIFFIGLITFVFSPGLTVRGQDAINKIQPLNVAVPVGRNDISANALRHFMKTFDEASSEKWLVTPDLFVALFSLHGIDYRVDYNSRNGNWIETFRTYSEEKMSDYLKEVVRSSYHDYTIFQVQEIEQPLHPLNYIVHLEGKARLINVRIYNGEVQEDQNFKQAD